MDTKQKIEHLMRENGITISAQFVPFSLSRNANTKWESLNWKCALVNARGNVIVETDYSTGIGHCPANKLKLPAFDGWKKTCARDACIAFEIENGFEAICYSTLGGAPFARPRKSRNGKHIPIQPDPVDVLTSLFLDANTIDDCADFTAWCDDLGCNPDSIKDHKMYDECLRMALALRASFGCCVYHQFSELATDL